MSCCRILQFCVNHSFLLNLPKSKIYDEEFVNYFKEIRLQLENNFDYYEKYSESSAETFRKSDAKEYTKNFVIKLSQYLNLTCNIAYELLTSYLLNDGKLDDNDLQSMLTRGYNTISLMQKIKKYYHEERLSLIRLIRYAFCDWKDEFLILSTIVLNASKSPSKKHLFMKLLQSFGRIVVDTHRDKSAFEYRDDNTDDDSAIRSPEEQVELLETLLLGAYSLKATKDIETFRQALTVFQSSGFCGELHSSKLFGSSVFVRAASERICLLQSLIVVELAAVGAMMVPVAELSSHFMGSNQSVLVQLNSVVLKLTGSRQSHGVLTLFAALLHSVFPQGAAHSKLEVGQLAQTAIVRLDLFQYITGLLTDKPYSICPSSEGSYVGLVVHSVLFELLSLLCHSVHLNSLEPARIRHDLAATMCVVLRPIIACSDVQPLNSGFMRMLEDLSLSFPADLHLLAAIGSLLPQHKGQQKSVATIAEFLDNLSWFCCDPSVDAVAGGGPLIAIEQLDDDSNEARRCHLEADYRPYRGLSLDKYTDGYMLGERAVLAVRYSAWGVVAAEAELLVEQLSMPRGCQAVEHQLQRVAVVIDYLIVAMRSGLQVPMVIAIFKVHLWTLVETDALLVEGCELVLSKLIELAGLVLAGAVDSANGDNNGDSDGDADQEDGEDASEAHERRQLHIDMVKRIVAVRNLFPHAQASADRIVSNQSAVENVWKRGTDPTAVSVAVVRAYLKFNVSLIECEKLLDTEIAGIIPSSLIFGSIIFVTRSVLDNLSKQSFANASDMTDLAGDCLIFLNEIMSIKPTSYLMLSDSRKSRLQLIQQVTHEIIVNTPTAVKVILSMSSIEVDILLKHNNLSNQMLAIHGTEEKLSQLVWMALTIVKYIFIGSADSPSDEEEEIVTASGCAVLLKILDNNENNNDSAVGPIRKRRAVMTNCQQYVMRMLEFLTYPYSIKIARMALDVLKLLVQNTDISIVACLGEKTGLIRDTFLRFIASSMEDQIVRANLFNFLTECVMRGRHGVLQLIGPGKSGTTNCYQTCVDIIRQFKPDDEVSVKLVCSISKFLSSLWLKECYPAMECLKNLDIWSCILVPTKDCLAMLHRDGCGDQNITTQQDQLLEFVGNVYGLFGMELYSSAAQLKSQIDAGFVKSLDSLVSGDLFIAFLRVFDRPQLESRLLLLDRYVKILLPPVTWWKTLLVTTLSTGVDSGIRGLATTEAFDLTTRLLDSISNLLAYSVAPSSDSDEAINNIVDQLSSCVLEMLHSRSSSFSSEQSASIDQQLSVTLSAMLPSHTTTIHARHADLLAACVLAAVSGSSKRHKVVRNSLSVSGLMQPDMESIAESYLFVLSTRLLPNKLESRAIVQAISLCITMDTVASSTDNCSTVRPEWLDRLADIGVLHNCLILLIDSIKRNDLSQLPQSILLLLIRAAHTRVGAARIIQSPLLRTLETDFSILDSDRNATAFLSQLMKLTVVLVAHNGPMAHEFGIRLVLAHWDELHASIADGCSRLGRSMASAEDCMRIGVLLEIGQSLFDTVWHLLAVCGAWTLHWPATMVAQLDRLVHVCINTVVAVVVRPHTLFAPNSAFIVQGKSKSSKRVSFLPRSPISKQEHGQSTVMPLDDAEEPIGYCKLGLASSRLELTVYQLVHSALLVLSRSTFSASEDCIYEGIDYNGSIVRDDFSESRLDKCDQSISFGCLFSLINSTHFLLKDGITLSIDNEKIVFNSDLMRQIHEIALSTIVSHSIIFLSRYDSANKAGKTCFLSNLRTELGYYLNEFTRTRRRNTVSVSSPSIPAPRITSTPYAAAKVAVEKDGFDLFCAGIDQFKKALDFM